MRKCLFLLIFTGCALGAGVRESTFNGEKMYEAKCNGLARTMANCYEQASNTCQKQNLKAVPLEQDHTNSAIVMGGNFTPITNRSLMFQCK